MNSTIVGLVAAIAVLSGGLGLSLTDGFDDQKYITSNTATGFLIGQVEIEARNADGELIAYRLSDNEVVDDGEQCIMKMLFGTTGEGRTALGGVDTRSTTVARGGYLSDATLNTTTVNDANCTGVLTGAWDVLAIGVGLATYTDETDHDDLVKMESESVGNGLDRNFATTKTWTNGTLGTDTTIVLKKTFTTTGIAASITEAGLFNSTQVSGSGMLAHQTFTAVALGTADSITVQWTFTVGN